MKHPVLAIGLDSAEPTQVERWLQEGHLPTLKRLVENGGYGRLTNYETYSAELPWTTFLTGCAPSKTGYWSPLKFHADTYALEHVGAYDFQDYKPFYALGDDYRIAVFDMPQAALSESVNGIQVLGWGAHSPQTPSHSRPAGLLDDLIGRHGPHPAFEKDNAEPFELEKLRWLQQAMLEGIRRKSRICCEMLRDGRWDLLLTLFGEPHSAGHAMWHLSDPAHPLYGRYPWDGGDPILEVMQEIDAAVAAMLEVAPDNTRVALFSAHGMESNSMDVPSMFFLPELMYRYSFNGKAAFAAGPGGGPVPEPIRSRRHWAQEIWARREDGNPLRRVVRRWRGFGSRKLERLIGLDDGPANPMTYDTLKWMPAQWYANKWPEMTAFGLPSFSDGYVRVNLAGRDRHGRVDPADYDRVCGEITDHLRDLVNPRTGQPIVDEIVRTRRSALDMDERLPDADLVVTWRSEPADVVDSPAFGRIGPVPFRRSGSHTSIGFLNISGPGIPAGPLPEGRGVDLAPTVLHMMGAALPNHFDGVSLLAEHWAGRQALSA